MKQLRDLPAGMCAIVIVILMLGICFRIINLDHKVYWHDEVFTSLRAAGFIGEQVAAQVFSGHILTAIDLRAYQSLIPGQDLDATLHSLTTHPEHPPLYYLLVRVWMEGFGSSITAVRSLSVVLSLLAFPALYWLCQELFAKPLVTWMAIALFAVSPVHVLYAQEARHYSLWTLATMLSCAALLRAMGVNTWKAWGLYTLALTLGFYTSLLSGMTVIAHGVYLLAIRKPHPWMWLKNFLSSVLMGTIAFLPWIIVLVSNWLQFRQKTGWSATAMPMPLLSRLWGLHLASDFIDFGFPLNHIYSLIAPAPVLMLVGVAFYTLYRQTAQQTWLLPLTLTLVPVIALMLPDLILKGQRSAHTRYFMPLLLGVLLAVAYLLGSLLHNPSSRQLQIGRGLTVIILTCGVLSCTISSQADTWWNKGVSYGNARAATVLNAANHPLVLSSLWDTSLGNVISLSHRVHDQVKFQLVVDPALPQISGEEGDRFLFYPTELLTQRLQEVYNFTIEPLAEDGVPLLRAVAPAPQLSE
jgi:uncharacterized membrane protein